MKITIEVTSLPTKKPPKWIVLVNGHEVGSVIRSPSGEEKWIYRDFVREDTGERYVELDYAVWDIVSSIINFTKETVQQRKTVDLDLAEPA